jgi:hypothetical protein
MAMPFPGSNFRVDANELSFGPGTITVLDDSFLFEANNHLHIGFDFDNVRLVRVRDINGFDVAYSIQGSIQKASFESSPKYVKKNDGVEKNVTTNPLGWAMASWKLRTITGAVVARTLVDRSGAQGDGFSLVTDEEFESQFRRISAIVGKLPSQKEIENGAVTSQELGMIERELVEVLLRLTDAWLMGNLSQGQREKVAALNYLDHLKRYELGWYHSTASKFYSEMTNQDYKENDDDWLTEEMKWGSDLRKIISVCEAQA